MKPQLLAFLLLSTISVSLLPAAPGDGPTLNITAATGELANTISANSSSGVFGTLNRVSLTNSIVVGESHGASSSFGGNNSLVAGSYNFPDENGGFVTDSSVIIGTDAWSIFNSSGYSVGPNTYSLIVGASNSVAITSGLVAGVNNYAVGRSFLLGDGLIASVTSPVAIVGRYNDETITGTPRFVVGNGTATVRRNALEVYDDGTVKIPKRQGDLRMGRFGNPIDQ